MIGKFVLVRTKNAGVHCGVLMQCSTGQCTVVELSQARRIWRWRGANSLHEMSIRGVSKDWSRISEPVDVIFIPEVIEVIPCTSEAEANLRQSRWSKE